MASLFAGILMGLAAGFAPGPLLTYVIAQTLRYNIREGVKVAFSPLITDAPIILVTLFVLTKLSDVNMILGAISIAGGLFVFYLAYESIRTGPVELQSPPIEPKSLINGAVINALNPHPYLFWFTVGSPIILNERTDGVGYPYLFLSGFYILLIGSKIVLALIVEKSRMFLTSKPYLYVMRGLGIALFIFAVLLVKKGLILSGIMSR